MSTFKYRILTKGSAVIEGKRTAESKIELVDYLKKSGYIVLKVQEIEDSKGLWVFSDRFTKKASISFTQELGILLESGISLDRSLKILSDVQENNQFKKLVIDILGGIKDGKSFAESISPFQNIFSNVYVSMVRAGEESGALPQVLKRLGSFMERMQRVRTEVISSLIYPIFLVLFGLLSVAAMILFVIPKFSTVFQEIGIALPLSTQIMINMNNVLMKYGWIIIFFLFGVVFLFKWLKKQSGIKLNIDKKKIHIPIIGDILWRVDVSRFARTLGTLLENGVPLLSSIDISKGVLANSFLSGIINEVKPEIKAGKGLIHPLGAKSFFPGIAIHLLTVGEETGKLDEMFIRVADNLDIDIEQRTKRFVSLIEPILILIMGCAIGLIVISMLSAIFSINEVSF
ncbi:MAG: type II secretion system F family protein [Candidatus Scalinduaceae bacterium]